MPSTYCSQGHSNAPGSRFCQWCGEKMVEVPPGVFPGVILGDRYRIAKELGQGGFGRTYLSEDLHRFREACVLKEFAPQVQGQAALKKAEELFEREAGVLYQMKHPQIPQFRELFRTQVGSGDRLFLVQDYVEGRSYQEVLEERRNQGQTLSEVEVTQLFLHLLPVLQFLHNQGVVHRDISPDNLILRSSDQMPVLIDFGGVKQLALSVTSKIPALNIPVTRVGKVGYAPEEQMEAGTVSPQNDLHALAVTALVLLSGQEPGELLGSTGRKRQAAPWKRLVKVSPAFCRVLEKMLAERGGDRFPNAAAVLQALTQSSSWVGGINGRGNGASSVAATPPPSHPPLPNPTIANATAGNAAVPPAPIPPSQIQTVNLGRRGHPANPTPQPANPAPITPAPARPPVQPATRSTHTHKPGAPILSILAIALLVGGTAAAVWFTRDLWLPFTRSTEEATAPPSPTETTTASPSELSPQERERAQTRNARSRDLGINRNFLIQITDDSFRRRHPELGGRSLTMTPADAEWRERWDNVANEWLDIFEQQLSPEARRKLGSYGPDDRAAWRRQVNQLNVGIQALDTLADARFFRLFPEWRGEDFLAQPIGQVWQAIAADQLDLLQSRQALETIRFPEGGSSDMVSGELAAGSGKVYLIELEKGQQLQLELDAPNSTLLSLYVPKPTEQTPFLLENSGDRRWSGELPQSGIYEIVLVESVQEGSRNENRSSRYRLSITTEPQ